MTDLRLTTGERIRILRERAGLRQSDLARQSNLSLSTLQRIETQVGRTMSVADLQKIAAVLGVPASTLLPDQP